MLGGGALLFYLLQNYQFKHVYINDVCSELINCYQCIKKDVNQVISNLKELQDSYRDSDDHWQYYQDVKNKYNSRKISKKFDYELCSYFIFLNRTCFNGLYRVNGYGKFNVPCGRYKNPLICDEQNLRLMSKLLKKVTISNEDYERVLSHADSNTFIYFDPPYRPLKENYSFNKYDKSSFDDQEQIRLAKNFKKVSKKKSYVMLSNSDPKNVNPNDSFFDELYKDFYIHRIYANRAINSNGKKRGKISELLITNYEV